MHASGFKIRDFKPRLYQETIFATAAMRNTLVVLPTGMGKTSIALMLAVQRLEHYPSSKVLVLAPTRPLAEQLMQVFRSRIECDAPEQQIVLFTGSVGPQKRSEMWKTARLVCSTPQGLENDVLSRRITLEDVSLLVFDEAHRATGDYSYKFVAKQYHKLAKYPRILGLTASPGSDIETINEVCDALFIENIEIRTESDPDVQPYVHDIHVEWREVDFPAEFAGIKKLLEHSLQSKLSELKSLGLSRSISLQSMSKKDLLSMQAQLHALISQGNKDYEILKSISLVAEIMKVHHALELLETQGISILHSYLEKLLNDSRTSKVKATQNIGRDAAVRAAFIKVEKLHEEGVEHPKLDALLGLVASELSEKPDDMMIIFTQFRETGSKILERLQGVPGCDARLFVGQQKKKETGMSQKQQIQMLNDFRERKFNTIIMTSVGEEGLDIPQVNTVLFYEPIPSAIRHIQRRGRTGRADEGRVIVLVTKGTRDGNYRWSAFHKEKRMHRLLRELKGSLDKGRITVRTGDTGAGAIRAGAEPTHSQKSISHYENTHDSDTIDDGKNDDKNEGMNDDNNSGSLKVFVDAREKGSGVVKELVERGCIVDITRLESADFLLSSRCAIEFKAVPDFVDSIVDGRLLSQLSELKRNFERPVIIIEGTEDIYSLRKIHTNAILGMLATIAVSYGIPIIQTRNPAESAGLLIAIAKREQQASDKYFSPHAEKPNATLKQQQEYVVSSLPFIGPKLARPLLERFGTVRAVMGASVDELKQVELIGEKKAKAIDDVLGKKYE